MGDELAADLALLRDRLPPFPGAEARAIIERFPEVEPCILLVTAFGRAEALRAAQGVASAAVIAGGAAALAQTFDGQARLRAFSLLGTSFGAGLTLGPVAAGWLTQAFGWRAIFWFNVVLGAVILAAAARFVPESADPAGRMHDLPGLVLGAVALTGITFAVIEGETAGYRTWWIIALFALAAAALAGFVAIERRAPDPVLRLDLLRLPAFSGSTAVGFATSFGLFAVFSLLRYRTEDITPKDMTYLFVCIALGLLSAANKGTILFVGTKRQAREIVAEEAQRCGMPYVDHRWLGGMLTNWKTISNSIKHLRHIDETLGKETSGLTKRELEVLTLLAEGFSVQQISRRLGLSVHTTRGYVKTLLVKLEAHSQLEAVLVAARRGLIASVS